MSAGFTPGPWRYIVNDLRGGRYFGVEIPGRDRNGKAFETIDIHELDNGEANAHLIAAAPELYADAEFLCARIRELEGELTDDSEAARSYYGHVIPALARMEAALAKATPLANAGVVS